eukprot:5961344-Alexandrium_andersonii.AAC.1
MFEVSTGACVHARAIQDVHSTLCDRVCDVLPVFTSCFRRLVKQEMHPGDAARFARPSTGTHVLNGVAVRGYLSVLGVCPAV